MYFAEGHHDYNAMLSPAQEYFAVLQASREDVGLVRGLRAQPDIRGAREVSRIFMVNTVLAETQRDH